MTSGADPARLENQPNDLLIFWEKLFSSQGNNVPFEELLREFVHPARQKIEHCASPLLTESAIDDLEASLLKLIGGLLGQVLELQFSTYRGLAGPDANAYRSFISHLSTAGRSKALAGYPALEPLVESVTPQWINSCGQLLQRLERDLQEISSTLLDGRATSKVERIECDLSDRHDDGQTVAVLRFASGSAVVYKPKQCDSDIVFHKLLAWLSERGAPSFHVPRLLLRGGYAWMEFVAQEPCTSEEQARLYYHRAGALLFAVYLLSGTDCHFDNVIACGEYPVLVDTETFYQPSIRTDADGYTVLSTGLVPGMPVAGCDASGFGAQVPQPFRARIPRWADVNTARMKLSFEDATLFPQRNVPVFRGEPCGAAFNAKELLAGFEQAYRIALAHRSELFSGSRPLNDIENCRIRFLVRGTLDYYFTVNRALHLRNLRGTKELAIQLPELSGRHAVFQPLIGAEIETLRRLDIPRFATTAGSLDLGCPEATLAGCFAKTGYQRIVERVRGLGEEDLARQMALIRICLA